MSSFRPFGANSESISVTKPYLYSRLAASSKTGAVSAGGAITGLLEL